MPVKPSVGDGMDSVLSILNMPRGVPVATVGVNNSTNAALLAVRILGAADEEVAENMRAYQARAKGEVLEREERMQEVGWYAAMEMWHGTK